MYVSICVDIKGFHVELRLSTTLIMKDTHFLLDTLTLTIEPTFTLSF